MSQTDARKLKPGDRVRLKVGGQVFFVSGREDSGRVIYGSLHHPSNKPMTVSNTDIRAENRGT